VRLCLVQPFFNSFLEARIVKHGAIGDVNQVLAPIAFHSFLTPLTDPLASPHARVHILDPCVPQGRDINLDIKRVVGYRNFCNKLWQGTRFLLGCFGDFMPKPGMAATLVSSQAVAPRDEWVLHKLNETVAEMTKCFELYEFGKGVQVLDSFFRGRLCDVYLELIKPSVRKFKSIEFSLISAPISCLFFIFSFF